MDVRAGRFPHVDALRGLATLMVLTIHGVGFFGGGLRDDAALRPVLARLEVAVPIFLVISSFLLWRPFVRAHLLGRPRPSVKAYGWRRVLRIVPAYWVALLVTALVLGTPGVLTADGVPTYFGFLQLYSEGTAGGGIPQAWTLCLEVTFYALLPVLAWAVFRVGRDRGLRAHVRLVVVLFAIGVVWKPLAVLTGATGAVGLAPEPWLSSLPGYLDVFAFGMGLAVASVVFEERPWPRPLAWLGARPPAAWGIALGAYLLTAFGIGLDGDPGVSLTAAQVVVRGLLFAVVATALMLPAVLPGPERGPVQRVLGSRSVRFLGLVSYGTYLWHWAVLQWLSTNGWADVRAVHPYVLWWLPPIAISVVLGALSWYLVERPALSLKRLAGPARTPPGEALAEPVALR